MPDCIERHGRSNIARFTATNPIKPSVSQYSISSACCTQFFSLIVITLTKETHH